MTHEHAVTIKLPERYHPHAVTVWPAIVEAVRSDGYHWLADQIEEQVKPAVEEPEAFGSLIRARTPQEHDQAAADLWQLSPVHGRHYWMSQSGVLEVWSELTDVEVLRVGLGEPWDTFSNGWDEGLRHLRKYVVQYASSARTQQHKDAYKEAMDRIAELIGDPPAPESRFCTRSQNCRMAEGHEGGCQR